MKLKKIKAYYSSFLFLKPNWVIFLMIIFFNNLNLIFAQAISSNTIKAQSSEYENAIEEYFNLNYNRPEFISGLVKAYRRLEKKDGLEYSFLKNTLYEKQIFLAFKESWKAEARQKIDLQEIKYLLVYTKSSIFKKISTVDSSVINPDNLVKLINPIAEKGLAENKKIMSPAPTPAAVTGLNIPAAVSSTTTVLPAKVPVAQPSLSPAATSKPVTPTK